jgi:hypothetical protein
MKGPPKHPSFALLSIHQACIIKVLASCTGHINLFMKLIFDPGLIAPKDYRLFLPRLMEMIASESNASFAMNCSKIRLPESSILMIASLRKGSSKC